MSAHFNDVMTGAAGIVPLAVLGASLLGSTHCVAMCGGLAISVGRTRSAVAAYHLGRLAGYLALGALAGALGGAVLTGDVMSAVSWAAAALMAGAFIHMGVNVWRGKGLHLFALPQRLTASLFRKAGGRPLVLGLLSALLPCGWLHGFVLGAAATRSPAAGAAFLLCFWLGTLPALSAAPWVLEKAIRPVATRLPRLSAILLITAGVACLALRAIPLSSARGPAGGGEKPRCHCSH